MAIDTLPPPGHGQAGDVPEYAGFQARGSNVCGICRLIKASDDFSARRDRCGELMCFACRRLVDAYKLRLRDDLSERDP